LTSLGRGEREKGRKKKREGEDKNIVALGRGGREKGRGGRRWVRHSRFELAPCRLGPGKGKGKGERGKGESARGFIARGGGEGRE